MNTNLKKKALLPLVAMVLVSVIAFSGVTYAWFTTANFATVTGLDVKVAAADGILISLDGLTWKSTLNADAIKNAVGNTFTTYSSNTNQYPDDDINPVSSNGKTNNNGKLNMFSGLLDNDKLVTAALTDGGKGGNYIAFDLFFKMSGDKVIKLDTTGSSVKDPDGSVVHPAYSARVAFINYGKSASATEAQSDTVVETNGIKIWEPNATKHLTGDGDKLA